ncbi:MULTISPECIES: response regulator transcription factor [unclassified Prochlorococcus]|uniref:response regulator transcription factor n=1 Tax=unclassified Prochlorococcus TaxID=2627481 RepID=UPI000533B589|nr:MULTISPECIES: response regulator transcription factor [unclassified Prochlorococcus]KGG26963.1 putative DNA-binding response regulator [Prochlorococcus sp. MIT 0702]KGG27193.1 putative DNA-binding response regulator [Prochlorococcus sp. MIT 0701]KGG33111.1 putative DNA-binding response regulator [Prochlorococcus sp. MIT 0703]
MEFNHHSEALKTARKKCRESLAGKTSVVCMGDRLALNSFCLVKPIHDSIAAASTTQAEGLNAVRKHRPDILFTSDDLEQGYGIDLVKETKLVSTEIKALIFLRRETKEVVDEALDAGADGVMFVSSVGTGNGDFINSLLTTLKGGIYYPADIRDLARDSKQLNDAPAIDCQLTERELEVLNAIVGGLSNKGISESLFVSTETVKSHVSTIISKLGVRDRTQAAVFAIRHCIVE